MDVHHTIFDGTSSKVFLTNVMTAYAGQELPKDYYYCILNKREKQKNLDFYKEGKEYFENRYADVNILQLIIIQEKIRQGLIKKLGREISKASGEGGFLSENWWLKWMRKK